MNGKEVSEALGDISEHFITEALTYKRKKLPQWFPVAAVAACLCLLVGLLVPAIGEMGYTPTGHYSDGYGSYAYFADGVSVDGLVIGGETENVILQDLQIALNLNVSPLENDRISDNTAVLDYTFHNPTEEAITLILTLPAGQNPRYAGSYEYETGKKWFDTNRHLYTASANGQPLDLALRLTGSDTPPQPDGEWSIGEFHNGSPVTKFTYEVQALESGENGYISIWGPGINSTIVLLEDQWGGAMINGNTLRTHDVSVGDIIALYVFGDAADFNPAWHFYADFKQEHTISGDVVLVSTQQMTFLEYAAQRWNADSGISQSDWACTLASHLNRSTYIDGMASLDYTSYLINRWFQYELTLDPGKTVVNTVTMPLYPDVLLTTGSKEAFTCHIDLLSLRMAQPLTGPVVSLNTPYELTESAAEYTETENGYTLDLTEHYKVSLELKLEDPQEEAPLPKEPAPQPKGQVHWLTVLGGATLTGLGLYWIIRRRTE